MVVDGAHVTTDCWMGSLTLTEKTVVTHSLVNHSEQFKNKDGYTTNAQGPVHALSELWARLDYETRIHRVIASAQIANSATPEEGTTERVDRLRRMLRSTVLELCPSMAPLLRRSFLQRIVEKKIPRFIACMRIPL